MVENLSREGVKFGCGRSATREVLVQSFLSLTVILSFLGVEIDELMPSPKNADTVAPAKPLSPRSATFGEKFQHSFQSFCHSREKASQSFCVAPPISECICVRVALMHTFSLSLLRLSPHRQLFDSAA